MLGGHLRLFQWKQVMRMVYESISGGVHLIIIRDAVVVSSQSGNGKKQLVFHHNRPYPTPPLPPALDQSFFLYIPAWANITPNYKGVEFSKVHEPF